MAETKLPAKQQDDELETPPNKPSAEGSLPAPANEPETPPIKTHYTGKGE